MSNSLNGKVALVTGGSRGLGAAVALALADEGADVAITYEKSKDRAEAVVAQIEKRGRRAFAFKSDQGNPSNAKPLIHQVVDRLGKLDILVNNAAVAWQGRKIDDPEIDNSAMDRQWAINVSGVVANIRAASNVLPEGGRIISVGSGVGTRAGFPGTADYAGTKAALIGYSKGVARDLGPRKITVNVVQAGIMATDMLAGSEDKLPASILDLHALGRIATVEEVAAGIVFLASPAASYVTGSVLDVNGGYLA
ncbi:MULTISPECIES: SDR family NAD(P)-dependent oxidoreductase [Rhizobium]|uniref:NAD(P)-dependent dehydrogenase (Short-subunit alcohol dehydrogenase family) n=1 Tax=Rhizobium esperanzae TaxID=1967781 RepID=A0A7W6XWI3_9HYPH|nr:MULTISPECIES: SDR family oxidoreductase [Rhizobium]MBB4440721.1 NAD(P)-dependent dehydrogenase (short-subunit alcohol dehydrogenase family) [Rhizobium esperanzae]MDH6203480.1 NAD(P)-dependent dehydrogenase (short-subunit alcohol dehydrogenase family) [Rhizobium leguminosarum]